MFIVTSGLFIATSEGGYKTHKHLVPKSYILYWNKSKW